MNNIDYGFIKIEIIEMKNDLIAYKNTKNYDFYLSYLRRELLLKRYIKILT